MIFAIVWGSILFVGGNIAQSAVNGHRNTTSGQVNPVPGDTPVLAQVIGTVHADH